MPLTPAQRTELFSLLDREAYPILVNSAGLDQAYMDGVTAANVAVTNWIASTGAPSTDAWNAAGEYMAPWEAFANGLGPKPPKAVMAAGFLTKIRDFRIFDVAPMSAGGLAILLLGAGLGYYYATRD